MRLLNCSMCEIDFLVLYCGLINNNHSPWAAVPVVLYVYFILLPEETHVHSRPALCLRCGLYGVWLGFKVLMWPNSNVNVHL